MEKQPKDIGPRTEIKPFNGVLINGVWMAPHPNLTEVDRRDLEKKLTAISQHRS